MISELANGQSGNQWDRLHRGRRWSEPDSDEPGTVRAGSRATRRRSSIGVENEARRARTKDGAGGGPAEEQAWARGRGTWLLKIGESRTRMRGRDDSFRIVRLTRIQISLSNGTISREPSARLVFSAVNRSALTFHGVSVRDPRSVLLYLLHAEVRPL